MAVLRARVAEHERQQRATKAAIERRSLVGSGQRGDKTRTIRTQDGIVTCERTGKKGRLKDYLKGDLSWLGTL
jgi:peptide chain release factor 1